MEVLIGIIIAIMVALALLVCSVIYLIFKSIQFTVQATNLYKKMIERQDMMINLLIDLRDGSKKAVASNSKSAQATADLLPGKSKLKPEEKWICQNCITENHIVRTECYECKTPRPT